MTITNARDLPGDSVLRSDVCIVGSGAAGIALARRLLRTKMRVLLVEAGGLDVRTAGEVGRWGVNPVGEPLRNPEPSRGVGVGGSTELWFGRIAVPDPIDFERREWVPHSGWPIGLDELRPWIDEAAKFLGVPNFDRIDIDRWEPNSTIAAFRRPNESELGVFLWSTTDNPGRHYRNEIERSVNVQLLHDATACALTQREHSGSIESLELRVTPSHGIRVESKCYVLAGGGIENPRLLLASGGPGGVGIGNERDLVGRFYMDHPRGEGLARVDVSDATPHQLEQISLFGERSDTSYGKVQYRLTFAPELQRRERLLNHAMHAFLASSVHETDAYFAARRIFRRRSNGKPDVVTALKGSHHLARFASLKVTGRLRPSAAVFVGQMEQEPNPDSRLTVDRGRLDQWGLPAVELDWRIGESTYRSQHRMHLMLQDLLRSIGLDRFESIVLDGDDQLPALWDMKHPSGTTRMAADPSEGVVDVNCRVHGVDNLYVAGSSVFPTVGHFNPTLVIVALAARLADHLEQRIPH